MFLSGRPRCFLRGVHVITSMQFFGIVTVQWDASPTNMPLNRTVFRIVGGNGMNTFCGLDQDLQERLIFSTLWYMNLFTRRIAF